MKKNIFAIVLFLMVFATVSQIQAQTQQQQAEIQRLQNEFSAGRITYMEYMRLMGEVLTAPETPQNPTNLVLPAGKAWVFCDNNIQGSGRAIIFNNDRIEFFDRKYGVWIPGGGFGSCSYTATGNRLSLNYDKHSGTHTFNFTISGNTLTITGASYTIDEAIGTYTLTDFTGPARPGGNIVNPANTAWVFDDDNFIYVYYSNGFGGHYVNRRLYLQGAYNANQSTGIITGPFLESVSANSSNEWTYSVTDFGGGRKTLRMWYTDRWGTYNYVFRLQSVPAGLEMPRTR